MIHTLTYNFIDLDVDSYEYEISENLKDIVKYLCESKFGEYFSTIDKNVKQYESQVEKDWLENSKTLNDLYYDYDFKKWLKDEYYEDAYNQCCKECISESGYSSFLEDFLDE